MGLQRRRGFVRSSAWSTQPHFSRSAAYVRLLRPRHALKNTFVLAGVAFAHQITNVPVVVSALLAFLAFSLTASGIYVLNDYVDRDVDRRHPTKRYRPLASGVVSPLEGLLLGSFCLCTGNCSRHGRRRRACWRDRRRVFRDQRRLPRCG